MRATWCFSIGLLAALCATPAAAQSPPGQIQLDFKADVQVDGVPINIQPDAALAPQLQAMVRKRVAQWRYRVGIWQGQPVPGPVSQRIVAEVLPVASGGFALRIKEVTYPVMSPDHKDMVEAIRRMPPPMYPQELMRRAVVGTLVYAYRIDEAGKARDIELVLPRNPDRDFRLLDAAGRAAIAKWTLPPTTVGDARVDCRVLTPITFSLDGKPAPKAPEVADYRAGHPELCPAGPVLLTPVEGSML